VFFVFIYQITSANFLLITSLGTITVILYWYLKTYMYVVTSYTVPNTIWGYTHFSFFVPIFSFFLCLHHFLHLIYLLLFLFAFNIFIYAFIETIFYFLCVLLFMFYAFIEMCFTFYVLLLFFVGWNKYYIMLHLGHLS